MSAAQRVIVAGLAALACTGFVALGVWQLERRTWKHELIARVEQRVHAAPLAAPGPDAWPSTSVARDEYRRVRLIGSYLHAAETLVQASTELGLGWWVLTPLRQADGTLTLINRGFVPSERRAARAKSAGGTADNLAGEVTVVGLLRLSESGGSLLQRNRPHDGRWYSRDVAAIAAARGLGQVAPWFVDAEQAGPALPDAPDAPIGGLTVIEFADNHLAYALTWLALAALAAAAGVGLWRVDGSRL